MKWLFVYKTNDGKRGKADANELEVIKKVCFYDLDPDTVRVVSDCLIRCDSSAFLVFLCRLENLVAYIFEEDTRDPPFQQRNRFITVELYSNVESPMFHIHRKPKVRERGFSIESK